MASTATSTRFTRALGVMLAASLALAGLTVPVIGGAEPVAAADETLGREPMLTPEQLGQGGADGLQYADPTEGLSLIDPPGASPSGSANLSYPLLVPPGRGITPDLALTYNSAGGNGWVGTGWDLGVGSVVVDTTFGAPQFDPDKESESYLLDGDLLVPNALGEAWEDRVPGDRHDFTRQVETSYERIIRHGDDPTSYFWEVRDKQGKVRWYGGHPDAGGPTGEPLQDADGDDLTIDRSAIITDENGNAVRWLLSARRDVGVNLIRYHYETVEYRDTDPGWEEVGDCTSTSDRVCAQHTYLSRIDYTAAAQASGHEEDPAYQVRFILESETDDPPEARLDPVVDASLGYVDLLTERLGRVEVLHAARQADGSRTFDGSASVAVRYDLEYADDAPFGKSLLASVTQSGGTADTATHTFSYYDEVPRVTDGDGTVTYQGFDPSQTWTTEDDLGSYSMLEENVSPGILGASTTHSGGGHVYLGFNPLAPAKLGSVGGTLQASGGDTSAVAEWMDINGDNLPDKVWLDGSKVKYRLNLSGANGTEDSFFAAWAAAAGIDELGESSNFTGQISVDAYLGVTASFGLGTGVTWSDTYFTDVNADGLPDLVSGGTVWFNRLEGGVPTFDDSSSGTFVPLATGGTTPQVDSTRLDELEAQLAAQSPLVDTVRRWVAPFAGTISIDAPAQLTTRGESTVDGVRLAIQHGGTELINDTLTAPDPDPDPGTEPEVAFDSEDDAVETALTKIAVAAGDPVYFRVGSIHDGTDDEVQWSPTITYTQVDGYADAADVPTDVNGLSQLVYDAEADFTPVGRPGTQVVMPHTGTVVFTATVTKTATTDDLELVLLHNGARVPDSEIVIAEEPPPPADPTEPTETTLSVEFDVQGPRDDSDSDDDDLPDLDTVSAHLAVGSQIDLSAVSWDPRLTYTDAQKADGTELTTEDDAGTPTMVIPLAPEIDVYTERTPGVSTPWISTVGGTYDAVLSVDADAVDLGAPVTVSVKTRDGVVAQASTEVSGTVSDVRVDLDAELTSGTGYWVEVTIADQVLAAATHDVQLVLRPNDTQDDEDDVVPDLALLTSGQQSVFPLAYRGWAVAGYTAEGDLATDPIDATAFVVDTDVEEDAADDPPDSFDDVDGAQAEPEPAYPFLGFMKAPGLPDSVADTVLPDDASGPLAGPLWQGSRDNLAANATTVRSSRLGTDSVDLGSGSTPSGEGFPITRIGVTGPTAALAAGIALVNFSLGVGPSFGLHDLVDLNGDGFPDVVTENDVSYTNQRGVYTKEKDLVDIINQDLTISVKGGLSAGLVDIKGNAKGKTNATSGNAVAKGGEANETSGGFEAGAEINASWTNPNDSGADDEELIEGVDVEPDTDQDALDEAMAESDKQNDVDEDLPPLSQELADVNGDGLADRVYTTANGVWVRYNLGYSFTDGAVFLGTGGFESGESYAGSASLGFSTPWGAFGGGAATNWNYDMARYTWKDINGDGILDQLHKRSQDASPVVRFGTGTGLLDQAVGYGTMQSADEVFLQDPGPQAAFDRATGVGGGFTFSVFVGPLCLAACYLVINPGANYQYSVSTTEVILGDVNGDGYADSLQTSDDDELKVRLNAHGRTNLLHEVSNPLGGTMELRYEREGNTVDHPGSVWALSRVTLDDGRDGLVDVGGTEVDTDGADVLRRDFSYDGLARDRLHRQSLGFSTVTVDEVDAATGTPLRTTEHTYLNDNVFVAGRESSVVVTDPATGDRLTGAEMTWGFRDVRVAPDDVHAQVDLVAPGELGPLTGVGSLTRSVAPLLTGLEKTTYVADAAAQQTATTYAYDALGNVLVEVDRGELETTEDDVTTTTAYSTCTTSSSASLGCPEEPDRPGPLWDEDLCPTWVSLPAEVTVTGQGPDGANSVLRHRDGRRALCDNASVSHLEEQVADGDVAVTDLAYDAWGSFDRIVHPEGSDGVRYAVRYTYDDDRHSGVAQVEEFDLPDGAAVEAFLTSGDTTGATRVGVVSSATYDPLSGRVDSRTDANGNTSHYAYDAFGRIVEISLPGSTDVLVALDYAPSADDYGYAVAHHTDVRHPGDTIDTVTFVDGLGRTMQTKRDATLHDEVGEAGTAGRIVTDRVELDALGRVVTEYFPAVDQQGEATAYDTSVPDPDTATSTVLTLRNTPVSVTEPGDRTTTFAVAFAEVEPGLTVRSATATDVRDRDTVTWTDVRGRVLRVDDRPDGEDALTSRYDYDPLGQLLTFTDSTGEVTTSTYDLLGRRTSTTTPDGGLVETGYDDAGRPVSEVSPNLRAAGQQTTYAYALDRLVGIDHPDGTPDVTYTYGTTGAADNGAGRVVQIEDGTRIVDLAYSNGGSVVRQDALMKLHNWDPAKDPDRFTWTTTWDYDGLGRLLTMTFPDGEELTHDYDAGGLVREVVGQEEGYEEIVVGFDEDGEPIVERRPRTWHYDYLLEQTYDEFLAPRASEYGNKVTTERVYDADTRWLDRQQTISPDRRVKKAEQTEIQDINYDYDLAGNVVGYRNELPKPEPSLFGGPSWQTYELDAYDRLVGAEGEWNFKKKDTRAYTLDLEMDEHRNVIAKTQRDVIRKKNGKEQVQKKTSYTYDRTYSDAAPGLAVSADGTVGERSYHFDANGNLLGTKDSKDKWVRELTWDATDRMTLVDDSSASTSYKYDDTGQRTIERGPGGETAFVNPWVTVRNGTEMFKHVWAGDERIATQRDDGGEEELKRFFLHKDLLGSTNMITDWRGDTFQHLEYFPSGEIWVMENSTVFWTPYLYGGHYYDERRDLLSIGARWYDARAEMLYAPDPVLVDDPTAVIDQPELRAAYSYAGSNPVSYVDPSGLKFILTQARANVAKAETKRIRAHLNANPQRAALGVELAAEHSHLLRSTVKAALTSDTVAKRAKFAALADPNPIVEINVSKGTVSIGAPYRRRVELGGSSASQPDGTSVEALAGRGAAAATSAVGSAVQSAVQPAVDSKPPKKAAKSGQKSAKQKQVRSGGE